MDNTNWPYKLELYTNTNNDQLTGLTCLSINMYPDQATGYEEYFHNLKMETLNGVWRWPAGLPDYLYPAGCSGIVFSREGPVLEIERAFKDKQRVDFQIRMHESYQGQLYQYAERLIANGFSGDSYDGSEVSSLYRKTLDIGGTSYDVWINVGANKWVWNFKSAFITLTFNLV